MRVKSEHYGIAGETGRDWMELALRLAGELDDALTITDPPKERTGPTAANFAGPKGLKLIREVEILNESLGGDVKQEALFAILKSEVSGEHEYAKMSEASLKKSYHLACIIHKKLTLTQQRKKKVLNEY